MKKFEDIDLINYVVNNGATLKDAAEFFEVSVDTIKKRMANIKQDLKNDSEILIELNEVSSKNVLEGRKKGGQAPNSGVVRNTSLETIAERAMIMLAHNLTIDKAAVRFSVAPSTLYDHLELLNCNQYAEIYADLQVMYQYHNIDKNSKTIPDIDVRRSDSNTTWLPSTQDKSNFGIEKIQIKYVQKLEELIEHKNSL